MDVIYIYMYVSVIPNQGSFHLCVLRLEHSATHNPTISQDVLKHI